MTGVLDRFALPGRKAVITGASRGLGKAFATALAQAGADVAVVARTEPDVKTAATDIAAATGRKAVPVVADVTRRADVERMIAEAADGLGGVDLLVNNAGVCFHRPAFEVPDDEWRQVFDVNVYGLWVASTEAARRMAAAGGGAIVNVGSISSIIVNRPQWQPAYNASKAAVHQLTKSLAAEWAPHNIRVNALAPGYVKTEMAPVDRPEFRRHWIEDVPQQRYATPEEIAPSVVYLASEASAFMTGSVLVIDGGYTIY
ncbi:MAG TPA: glucose 1-dehydrogenase [Streptosporangiaceae bacterium]|jgi:NAD(P)-dependent dehydrogenase (short-subunit alcohol dehydrogenase family)